MQLANHKPGIDTWMYSERYQGIGTRTYSTFASDTDVNQKFDPLSKVASFTVPTKRLSYKDGLVYKQSFGEELQQLYFYDDHFFLPIHPGLFGDIQLPYMSNLMKASDGPELTVIPSASVRTVLVKKIDNKHVTPHFVKLHYPKRISRFKRRLRHKIITLQMWASNELYVNNFTHLPEVASGLVGQDKIESWGFILRSATPTNILTHPHFTLPLFALYGEDYNNPGEPSLVQQLIDASDSSPVDWFEHHIADPLAKMWCTGALNLGLLLEIHGQNGLIQITPNSSESQIVYRDCDVYIDPELRARSHQPSTYPRKNIIGQDVAHKREQMISLIYDGYVGDHMLQFIGAKINEVYGVGLTKIQDTMKNKFLEYGEALISDFPKTEYYYAEKLFDDNNWELRDTRTNPRWRTSK